MDEAAISRRMTCTNVHIGVYIKVYTLYIYILGWICVFHDGSNDVCVRVEDFFYIMTLCQKVCKKRGPRY